MDMAGKLNYRIFHSYDVGDQGVSILAGSDFDVIRAAVYIQFKVEEWFGDTMSATNPGIAAALVSFYGCKHSQRTDNDIAIDMYSERESLNGESYKKLISDKSMLRQGLREFIGNHIF